MWLGSLFQSILPIHLKYCISIHFSPLFDMHVHHFTEAPDLLGLTPAFLGSLRSFLVVGDPLCATTHTDLWLRARPRTDGLSPLGNHGKSSCGEKRVGIPIDFAGKRTLPFRCSTMHRCLAQLLRSSCWEQQQIWCH